jgi:hypothetical protein
MTKWEIKHNTVYHITADGKELTTCDTEETAVLLLGFLLETERRSVEDECRERTM